MDIENKKSGTASESDISAIKPIVSPLVGTTWNFQMNFNNGNQSSGQFIFKPNGVCIIQQLNPSPIWWTVAYSENGNKFAMKEQGAGNSYALYKGSHYKGKGSGSYTVYPDDSSQDASFTMTKA